MIKERLRLEAPVEQRDWLAWIEHNAAIPKYYFGNPPEIALSRTLKKVDGNNTKLMKDNMAVEIKKMKHLTKN